MFFANRVGPHLKRYHLGYISDEMDKPTIERIQHSLQKLREDQSKPGHGGDERDKTIVRHNVRYLMDSYYKSICEANSHDQSRESALMLEFFVELCARVNFLAHDASWELRWYIGGSELSKIMGVNKFGGWFSALEDRLKIKPQPEGAEMLPLVMGTILEPMLERFVEAVFGVRFRGDQVQMQCPSIEVHRNSPDGFVIACVENGSLVPHGKPNCILHAELKNLFSRAPFNGVVDEYKPQCLSGLSIARESGLPVNAGLFIHGIWRPCAAEIAGIQPGYSKNFIHGWTKSRNPWMPPGGHKENPMACSTMNFYCPPGDVEKWTGIFNHPRHVVTDGGLLDHDLLDEGWDRVDDDVDGLLMDKLSISEYSPVDLVHLNAAGLAFVLMACTGKTMTDPFSQGEQKKQANERTMQMHVDYDGPYVGSQAPGSMNQGTRAPVPDSVPAIDKWVGDPQERLVPAETMPVSIPDGWVKVGFLNWKLWHFDVAVYTADDVFLPNIKPHVEKFHEHFSTLAGIKKSVMDGGGTFGDAKDKIKERIAVMQSEFAPPSLTSDGKPKPRSRGGGVRTQPRATGAALMSLVTA